jgi:hypothetical protein
MHDPVTPLSKSERDELQFWYDNGGKEALLYHLRHEVAAGAYDPYAPAPLTAGSRCTLPCNSCQSILIASALERSGRVRFSPFPTAAFCA